MSELFNIAYSAYVAKFGNHITVSGLSTESMYEAIPILVEAVRNNEPLTEAEFYAEIGMEPPDEDVDV